MKRILVTLLICGSLTSVAASKKEMMNHPAVSAATVMSNLTWGFVNSVVGAGYVAATAVAACVPNSCVDFPKFELSPNGKQIFVNVNEMMVPMSTKISLGVFELSNNSDVEDGADLSAAYAVQSAVLGPFYLPAILGTYAVYGWANGPLASIAMDCTKD